MQEGQALDRHVDKSMDGLAGKKSESTSKYTWGGVLISTLKGLSSKCF